MFCSKCGKEIDESAKFCPSCGNNIGGEEIKTESAHESNKVKNKIDWPKKSILMSALTLCIPLGQALNSILLRLLGIVALIPALVVAVINLIKPVFLLIKNRKMNSDIIIRFACLLVIPLSLLISGITSNPVNYRHGMKAFEDGDYETAYEMFSDLDYKDSEKMAIESRYQMAIMLAKDSKWGEALVIFDELEKSDYRASRGLEFYCAVKVEIKNTKTIAENKLIPTLKNPSSYTDYGFTCSSSVEENNGVIVVAVDGKLKYSATNSFGGVVTDTYAYNRNVTMKGYDVTLAEAKDILSKTIDKIATDYDK